MSPFMFPLFPITQPAGCTIRADLSSEGESDEGENMPQLCDNQDDICLDLRQTR